MDDDDALVTPRPSRFAAFVRSSNSLARFETPDDDNLPLVGRSNDNSSQEQIPPHSHVVYAISLR